MWFIVVFFILCPNKIIFYGFVVSSIPPSTDPSKIQSLISDLFYFFLLIAANKKCTKAWALCTVTPLPFTANNILVKMFESLVWYVMWSIWSWIISVPLGPFPNTYTQLEITDATAPSSVGSHTLLSRPCLGTAAALSWWKATHMSNSYTGTIIHNKCSSFSSGNHNTERLLLYVFPVPLIKFPHLFTWSVWSLRHPAWFCAWAFLLGRQPTLGTRYSTFIRLS